MTASAESSATFQAPVIVVRDAAKVVLRHLEALPGSEERERLQAIVVECTRTAEGWRTAPPGPRDVDALMKRLLAVHVQVARLEYDGSVRDTPI
jgi:hypothetical protein